MDKIKQLMLRMDEMRKQMNDLIQEKENLVYSEVVAASQSQAPLRCKFWKIGYSESKMVSTSLHPFIQQ